MFVISGCRKMLRESNFTVVELAAFVEEGGVLVIIERIGATRWVGEGGV